MSQAEDLLNSLTADDTTDGSTITRVANGEVEEHIVIDKKRYIIVPDNLKRIAVQYDHNVETVTFDCPRYWDGRDISSMRILIVCARGNGQKTTMATTNVVVDETDNSIFHFDWEIDEWVTTYNGKITFLVCATKTDADGNLENHWNSELNKDMYVSEGMDCNEVFKQEYPDVYAQILMRLDDVEGFFETAVTREEFNQSSNTKADKTTVDTELGKKANKTDVENALGTKANKTDVDNALSTKADKTTVDTELGKKANKTDVDNALSTKADKTTVESLTSTKADKTTVETIQSSLIENTRKTEALWQFHQGVTHWFEDDSASVYQRDVPSGAKMASLKQIGGKTIVWNQMAECSDYPTDRDGITFSAQGDKNTFIINGTATNYSNANGWFKINTHVECIKNSIGHKIFMKMKKISGTYSGTLTFGITATNVQIRMNESCICINNSSVENVSFINLFAESVFNNLEVALLFIDLTLMFGAGNEPSTVEEFEAMFPEDYYEYNEGTLMSMPCNEVVEQGKNLLDYEKRDEYTGYNFIADNALIVDNTYPSIRVYEFNAKSGEEYTYYVSVLKNITCAFGNGNSIDNLLQIAYSKVTESTMITVTVPDGYDKMYICIDSSYKELFFVAKGNYSEISPYHCISHPIPQAILDLDGYGDSVSDDIFNYIDYDRKQYVKRVGKVDLGTFGWIKVNSYGTATRYDAPEFKFKSSVTKIICSKYTKIDIPKADVEGYNIHGVEFHIMIQSTKYTDPASFKSAMSGVMLYYELAEPVITDISDLLISAAPFDVEPGGTLTFKNTNGDGYRVPIHNSVEYAVKLEEVL